MERIRDNKKNFIIALAMMLVVLIGGVMAYFTSTDSATNTFAVGEVKIDLDEPNWVEPENITPNQAIIKDPQITNIGVNDAYVFLKVTVPKATVETAAQDGTVAAAAVHQLFQLNNASKKAAVWSETDTINSTWVQVGERTSTDDAYVYVFAYGTKQACTKLAKDATTAALFDSVTFINATEGQGLENGSFDINIEAFGIQTDNINGNGTNGKVAPADVWAVLSKQTPATANGEYDGNYSPVIPQ